MKFVAESQGSTGVKYVQAKAVDEILSATFLEIAVILPNNIY